MVALGGACVVAMGGHAWLLRGDGVMGGVVALGGVVAPGGMHGCSRGGMHGCCQGACMVAPGGMHGCCWGVCMLAAGGMHGCSGGGSWDMTRYRDMINEWAVRILLECILILKALVDISSIMEPFIPLVNFVLAFKAFHLRVSSDSAMHYWLYWVVTPTHMRSVN